jgi:hypothetical protein
MRERWYLICDHPVQASAFVFGPFRKREKAERYPKTFMGFVDAPAFRYPITTRVERHDDWGSEIR